MRKRAPVILSLPKSINLIKSSSHLITFQFSRFFNFWELCWCLALSDTTLQTAPCWKGSPETSQFQNTRRVTSHLSFLGKLLLQWRLLFTIYKTQTWLNILKWTKMKIFNLETCVFYLLCHIILINKNIMIDYSPFK